MGDIKFWPRGVVVQEQEGTTRGPTVAKRRLLTRLPGQRTVEERGRALVMGAAARSPPSPETSPVNPSNFRFSFAPLVLLFVGFGACGAQRGPEPSRATDSSPVPASASAERALPRALDALESGAEDAYDYALAGQTARVATAAQRIGERWQGYRTTAASAGASSEVLSEMDAAVRGLEGALRASADPVTLARATNAISAPMDDLFALYDTPVPSSVLELDYLGREVALDARQGSFDAAGTHLDRLEHVFTSVRRAALAQDGQREVEEFQGSVNAMRAATVARDAHQLEVAANAELELVDGLEHVFERAEGREGGEEEDDD